MRQRSGTPLSCGLQRPRTSDNSPPQDRATVRVASLLSSLPAWRLVDPLPVLSRVDEEEDHDQDEEAFVSFDEASPPLLTVPEQA